MAPLPQTVNHQCISILNLQLPPQISDFQFQQSQIVQQVPVCDNRVRHHRVRDPTTLLFQAQLGHRLEQLGAKQIPLSAQLKQNSFLHSSQSPVASRICSQITECVVSCLQSNLLYLCI